ncbi:hypothetical protein [Dehalobacter restrictus]|uniref:Lipoprotein n=1 Tax=Dehalobacter restrictus TaxID=55583 RepID=A0A857DIS0_9FIRM|nr:hypothetical protein [Dehalobacter restrictus]QHA01184.1 hypothetical protein GQ588_11320 [Dehalobacter restrictus]
MNKILICIFSFLLSISLIGCSTTQDYLKNQVDTTTQANEKLLNAKEENYKQTFGNVKILTVRAQLPDGRPWTELGISNKGEVFGIVPRNNEETSELIIFDVTNNKLRKIYSLSDDFQIYNFKFNDNYLVWIETTNSLDSSRLVVYDRKNDKSEVINQINNRATQIPLDDIALGSNYLLWSSGKENYDKVDYKIMKYSMETKKISVFMENAAKPIIGEYFIAWLGPEDERLQNSAIFFNDLRDTSVKKIITSQNPQYLSTDGNSIIFSGVDKLDKNIKRISLLENGQIKIIRESATDYFEFPEISSNFIGWRGTTKLYVYCRANNKIAVLTEEFASYTNAYVSDNFILWHSPVIKDENEAKEKATEQGAYLSDLHIINVQDIK